MLGNLDMAVAPSARRMGVWAYRRMVKCVRRFALLGVSTGSVCTISILILNGLGGSRRGTLEVVGRSVVRWSVNAS